MNDRVLKIIKISFAFILAVCFVVTAMYTYRDIMKYFYELSFLGNIFTGVFLFVIGIVWIFNKQIPQYIILDFTVLMLLILGVEVVTQDFYFKDGWAFVHFVNPVLMFIYYMFASKQKNVKWYLSFTALVLPIIYMIFAFIFGACTGDYIYDFLDFNEYGVGNTVLFIFITAVGLSAISVGIHFLNRLLHKYILKKI